MRPQRFAADNYGCAHHKDRGTCSNDRKVARRIVEDRLLEVVRSDLLSETAFRQFMGDLREILAADGPNMTALRRNASAARGEVDNLIGAIRQGIIAPSVQAALVAAEARLEAAEARIREAEDYRPAELIPRARDLWLSMVARIEQIEDIAAAREALREMLGEIRIVPKDSAGLVAEISVGLPSEIIMVAGARYDHYLTPAPRVVVLR